MARHPTVKIFTCLLAVGCAPQHQQPVATIDREALAPFESGVQPGCAMGVYGPGGKVSYRFGGYADIDARRLIDEHTAFLVASMSKQFTALTVLQLAEAGRLDLHDQARRWVPELAGAVQDATIEQLLQQTAGVRDHVNLLALSGVEVLGTIDRAETLRLMARQRDTNFPPGTRAQYSNGNYFVLSEIVERVSGEPLERHAERVIFAPLGMRDTYFLPGSDTDERAQGYQPQDEPPGFRIANDRPATNGSGGLVTTLADLRRFDADFRAEAVVWTPRIKRQMLTPGRLISGETAVLPEFGTPYGMGLGLAAQSDDLRVFHAGGAEGFRAEYVRLLRQPVSVAVLCNRVDGLAPSLADGALRRAANLPPDATDSKEPAAASTAFRPPSPDLLRALEGNYRAEELDTDYTFRIEGDHLEVTIRSGWAHPAPVIETWGGLQTDDDGILHSGPLSLQLLRQSAAVQAISLSFGKRAQAIRLERMKPSH